MGAVLSERRVREEGRVWPTKATLPAPSAHPKQTVRFHCVQAQTVKLCVADCREGRKPHGAETVKPPSLLSPTTRRTFDMIFFSAASTTPSFDNTPTAAPAWLMASMAYST